MDTNITTRLKTAIEETNNKIRSINNIIRLYKLETEKNRAEIEFLKKSIKELDQELKSIRSKTIFR